MKYPWAVVGKKVECIKHGAWSDILNEDVTTGPAFGEILTISLVEVVGGLRMPFLEFSEIPVIQGSFGAVRFRPVYSQHRASDIALFEPHLNTTSQPSTVDA